MDTSDALHLALDTFANYARLHAEKGTEEGSKKARANWALVDQMRAALAALAAPQVPMAREALQRHLDDALTRMDRARKILTCGEPTPSCNWLMLDTTSIRQALATASPEAAQPVQSASPKPGWQLVPQEATREMIAAGKSTRKDGREVDEVYESMLRAAPDVQSASPRVELSEPEPAKLMRAMGPTGNDWMALAEDIEAERNAWRALLRAQPVSSVYYDDSGPDVSHLPRIGRPVGSAASDAAAPVGQEAITALEHYYGVREPEQQAEPAPIDAGVHEALHRLIENAAMHGSASQADAVLVAKHQDALSRAADAQAAGAGVREALLLAQEYVENAANRMYDGTNGQGIRAEAFRRLAVIDAALAAAPAPAPEGVREAIGNLLAQAMEQAVANGANSVSMPDEYVEIAQWLAAAPPTSAEQQSAPGDTCSKLPYGWRCTDYAGHYGPCSAVKVLHEHMKVVDGRLMKADQSAAPPPAAARAEALSDAQVPWRQHVEERMRTWRETQMNHSGDRLALDDFMDSESLEDLIDFVCDEWSSPEIPDGRGGEAKR